MLRAQLTHFQAVYINYLKQFLVATQSIYTHMKTIPNFQQKLIFVRLDILEAKSTIIIVTYFHHLFVIEFFANFSPDTFYYGSGRKQRLFLLNEETALLFSITVPHAVIM